MAKTYKSKWHKFKLLKKCRHLSSTLPSTKPFSKKRLWKMLKKHRELVLKPVGTKGGEGILQLTSIGNDRYKIHYEDRQKKMRGKKAAIREIFKRMKGNSYIIQQKIQLATIHDRPFDLRVMVQRGKRTPWKVTGKLAKWAGKGYLVTNIKRSKGKVLSLKQAIQQSSVKTKNKQKLSSKIHDIALSSAKCLTKSYRWLRTVGMDMGIDHKGKIWIIEANFAPDITLFLKLKNKKMFHRIRAMEREV
ncbi:YheC/YheD family protein [Ammoniphilus sp. CFH 90114]|uniref:YheC/YheD family protein n=1 Tax=Ammoniphilus sp. CFH 90114 TaxID=2493665 RepID=UPI00100F4C7B|nr:YheC/YheD family protein [Ammoniphilus sp. CFH 90114]RXT15274.1 hypothetical protein EIZ39_03435 [Ammoniphilus sp. CFH 90114]